MTALPADLIADAFGRLPGAWCEATHGQWLKAGDPDWKYLDISLNHPNDPQRQTAMGCLRLLAMWAGDDGAAQAYWLAGDERGWNLLCPEDMEEQTVRYRFAVTGITSPAEALVAILTRIGLDHRIRRAWGEEPKPGTLAHLSRKTPDDDRPWWCWTPDFDSDGRQYALLEYEPDEMSDVYKVFPFLAGITDPDAVLVAIDKEMWGTSR